MCTGWYCWSAPRTYSFIRGFPILVATGGFVEFSAGMEFVFILVDFFGTKILPLSEALPVINMVKKPLQVGLFSSQLSIYFHPIFFSIGSGPILQAWSLLSDLVHDGLGEHWQVGCLWHDTWQVVKPNTKGKQKGKALPRWWSHHVSWVEVDMISEYFDEIIGSYRWTFIKATCTCPSFRISSPSWL